MKKSASSYVADGLSIIETIVFLALTLAQYVLYYEGLRPFVEPRFGFWPILAIVFFTYMFRIDVLAAAIGFYGAWKVLGWPIVGAALLSCLFMVMSLSVNYGIKRGMRWKYFRREWSAEDTHPKITKEEE